MPRNINNSTWINVEWGNHRENNYPVYGRCVLLIDLGDINHQTHQQDYDNQKIDTEAINTDRRQMRPCASHPHSRTKKKCKIYAGTLSLQTFWLPMKRPRHHYQGDVERGQQVRVLQGIRQRACEQSLLLPAKQNVAAPSEGIARRICVASIATT